MTRMATTTRVLVALFVLCNVVVCHGEEKEEATTTTSQFSRELKKQQQQQQQQRSGNAQINTGEFVISEDCVYIPPSEYDGRRKAEERAAVLDEDHYFEFYKEYYEEESYVQELLPISEEEHEDFDYLFFLDYENNDDNEYYAYSIQNTFKTGSLYYDRNSTPPSITTTSLRGRTGRHHDARALETINIEDLEEEDERKYLRLSKKDRTTFHMKLHWVEGYCWQEEWQEREWCMECAGSVCQEGDVLWLHKCQEYDLRQRFEWIERKKLNQTSLDTNAPYNPYYPMQMQYGMLKVACSNLCYQQIRVNAYELRTCNFTSPEQILARNAESGVITSDIFELYPYERYDKCLNQHHHPKGEEFILLTFCDTARNWDTNYWKMFWVREDSEECMDDPFYTQPGKTGYLRLRDPECNKQSQCGVCTGDCDEDDHCEDGLLCFKRDDWEPVPGCSGDGNRAADYCYDPANSVSQPQNMLQPQTIAEGIQTEILRGTGGENNNKNNKDSQGHYMDGIFSKRSEDVPCSLFSKCDECQGDCDSDRQCGAGLVCFQRSNDEPVPGCSGTAETGVDYCVNPFSEVKITNQHFLNNFGLCRRSKPCAMCQGNCNSNDVCSGDLKCFSDFISNDLTPIPGCFGNDGIPGNGYCYKK